MEWKYKSPQAFSFFCVMYGKINKFLFIFKPFQQKFGLSYQACFLFFFKLSKSHHFILDQTRVQALKKEESRIKLVHCSDKTSLTFQLGLVLMIRGSKVCQLTIHDCKLLHYICKCTVNRFFLIVCGTERAKSPLRRVAGGLKKPRNTLT